MWRTIKITAGMTGEFEIISTNATDSAIEAQLRMNNRMLEDGIRIDDAYGHIKELGFVVNLIGSHEDLSASDLDEAIIDKEFDYYDYDMEEIL